MIGRLSKKAQRYEFQAKFEFDRIWSIRYLVGQAPDIDIIKLHIYCNYIQAGLRNHSPCVQHFCAVFTSCKTINRPSFRWRFLTPPELPTG